MSHARSLRREVDDNGFLRGLDVALVHDDLPHALFMQNGHLEVDATVGVQAGHVAPNPGFSSRDVRPYGVYVRLGALFRRFT